jgi:hypothetical protein
VCAVGYRTTFCRHGGASGRARVKANGQFAKQRAAKGKMSTHFSHYSELPVRLVATKGAASRTHTALLLLFELILPSYCRPGMTPVDRVGCLDDQATASIIMYISCGFLAYTSPTKADLG